MSITESGNIVDIRAIKQRLWNPVNGKTSSELDITLSTRARVQQKELQAQEQKAKEDFERRLKVQAVLEEAIRQSRRARAIREQEIAEALDALESLSPPPPPPLALSKILEVVRNYYGITYLEMMSRRKSEKLNYARQVAMYLCQVLTKKSYPEIARALDNRDHTTVMHGARKIKELVDTRPHIAAEIEDLKKRLEAPQ